MLIDMANTNWQELRKQKQTLVDVISLTLSPDDEEKLTGILHFIDHVQDEAAKQLGAEAVFGKD